MKKFFLPLVLILLLSSCSFSVGKQVIPNTDIDGLMCFDYMQTEYTVHIKTDVNGNMTAEIQSPENLKGISVICRTDGMAAKCGEVEISSADGYYPFRELHKAISCVREAEPISSEENNGKYYFKYKDENGQRDIVTDATGEIEYISTPVCVFEKR